MWPEEKRPPYIDRLAYLYYLSDDHSNLLELKGFAAADNTNLNELKKVEQSTPAVMLGIRAAYLQALEDIRKLLLSQPKPKAELQYEAGQPLPLDSNKSCILDPSIEGFPDKKPVQDTDSSGKLVGQPYFMYTIKQCLRWRISLHIENEILRTSIQVRCVISTNANEHIK